VGFEPGKGVGETGVPPWWKQPHSSPKANEKCRNRKVLGSDEDASRGATGSRNEVTESHPLRHDNFLSCDPFSRDRAATRVIRQQPRDR